MRGSDVITDPGLIRRHFPYLAPDTVALDEACALAEQSAAQSLLDLRPLAARQGEGWVASLPVGRSVKVEVAPSHSSKRVSAPLGQQPASPELQTASVRVKPAPLPAMAATVPEPSPSAVVQRGA